VPPNTACVFLYAVYALGDWEKTRIYFLFFFLLNPDGPWGQNTVPSLIHLNETVNSLLLAAFARLTTKRYKVLPIRAKYHSVETIKSTYLYYSSSYQEVGSDSCVQFYQWTRCIYTVIAVSLKIQRFSLTCELCPKFTPTKFCCLSSQFSKCKCFIYLFMYVLAEIPGVARDSR
jgi:hypothetical protein